MILESKFCVLSQYIFWQYISYEITGLMPHIPEFKKKFDVIFWNVEGLEPDSGRNLNPLKNYGYLFSKQEFWVLLAFVIIKLA